MSIKSGDASAQEAEAKNKDPVMQVQKRKNPLSSKKRPVVQGAQCAKAGGHVNGEAGIGFSRICSALCKWT